MPDAAERITMRHLRTRATIGITCAVLTLTAASCSSDNGGGEDDTSTETTSSTSSATASPAAYGDEHVYAEAEKAIRTSRKHDFNKPIPKGTAWATPSSRKAYNEEVAEYRDDLKVTQKGKITTTGIEPAESNAGAPGGWDLTMYACTTSTVRAYDEDGNDVTGDPATGDPLPDKPRSGVDLVSLMTPDRGKTWQIENVQALSGQDAKEASCAA